jgi:hypothetical protein
MDVSFIGKNMKIKAVVPIKTNQIKAVATINKFEKKLFRTTFEPVVFAEYKFDTYWKINAKAFTDYQFAAIETLYPAYIFNSLDLSANGSDISTTSRRSANANLLYENVVINTSVNMGYTYVNKLNNVILNRKIQSNGQQILEAINFDNQESSKQYRLGLGRFFPNEKINLALSYLVYQSQFNNLLNNTLLTSINNGQSVNLKLNYNKISWFNADYNTFLSVNRIQNNSALLKSTHISHRLQAYISPIKDHSINLTADYAMYRFEHNLSKNQFLDIGYRFVWSKKKIDFDINWMNILNKKSFQQINISDIQINQTNFTLRPSQLIFSAKFNFR